MNCFFDTSVLIQVLVDQLPEHERALAKYTEALQSSQKPYISCHTIAECYATLSALPLKRKITPYEAHQLVTESIISRVQVVELTKKTINKRLKKRSPLILEEERFTTPFISSVQKKFSVHKFSPLTLSIFDPSLKTLQTSSDLKIVSFLRNT